MDVIKQWLKAGKVYAVGVAIYNQVGTDANLRRLLNSEAETPYKRERLQKALMEIAAGKQAVAIEDKAQEKGESAVVASMTTFKLHWPREACKDEVELAMWEQVARLLKERAHLHASLFHQTGDDARRAAAFQLLRKDDELDGIYEKRKYYLREKHLPEQPAVEYVTDPVLMLKRAINLDKSIRRNRQTLAKGPNPDAQARLEAYIKEYNHYAPLLGKEEVKC